MKHSFKKLKGSLIEAAIEFPLEEFKGYVDHAITALKSNLELKGFRKGMAPDSIADQYVDRDKAFNAAAERAVKDALKDVSEEHNWTIIGTPEIHIKDSSATFGFTAKFPIFPEVNLENYESIAQKEQKTLETKAAAIEVPEKEVTQAIEWLQNARATLVAKPGPAAMGDAVEVDVTTSLDPKPASDRFILGKGRFMPGFEEHVIGHSAGETFTFALTAPANYWKEDLRGEEISFTVHLKDIFTRTLPELDDEFAKSAGSFTTFAELTTSIQNGIRTEKREREEERASIAALEAIAKKADIDIPVAMVDRMKAHDPKATEEEARHRLSLHLVIYAIGERAGLKPTEEEVDAEVHREKSNPANAKIDTETLRNYAYEHTLQRKVYAHLIGKKDPTHA